MALSRQQIFNRVSKHLLTQKEKAVNSSHACLYRLKKADGKMLKCAIGALIKDQFYGENLENKTPIVGNDANKDYCIWDALYKSGIVVKDYNDDDARFLRELQRVHDGHDVENWKHKLERFADVNNLNTVQLRRF